MTTTTTEAEAAEAGAMPAFKYEFDPTSESSRRQIRLPRKDHKQARTLLRRMETKTAQFSVYYSRDQRTREERDEAARKEAEAAEAAAKKKSWFFGGGGGGNKPENDNDKEPVEANREGDNNGKENFLGKVTIEFGRLLARGCI